MQSQDGSPDDRGVTPPPTDMAALSGIDWLRAALERSLPPPPLVAELGIRLVHVDDGLVVGEYDVDERHLNGYDKLHGGILATLADTAGACAVLSTIPAGAIGPTLAMTVNFVRPVARGQGTLRAEGRLVSRGRTTALAEARITDPTDRLVAHATVTCSIVSRDTKEITG